MNYYELRWKMPTGLFFRHQVARLFPKDSHQLINSQLSRWVAKSKLVRVKREMFLFPGTKINEFVLANFIYRPSYVSLESALNYYGIIPDVAPNVTSVSPTTTKTIRTGDGVFIYSKIAKSLYFGWQIIKDAGSEFSFSIAEAEKALLDYVYVRKIRDLDDQRADLAGIDRKKLVKYGKIFPAWVMRAINEQYRR